MRSGELWDVTLYDRTGYSYGNHAEILGVSPEFDAQSGFVNRVNIVHGRLFNRFTWYGKPGARLENTTTFIGIEPIWHYDDFFKLKSTIEGTLSQMHEPSIPYAVKLAVAGALALGLALYLGFAGRSSDASATDPRTTSSVS